MTLTEKQKEVLAHAFSGAKEKDRVILEFSEGDNGSLQIMDITQHVDQLEEMLDE